MEILTTIWEFLYREATSHPLIFLLFMAVGVWLIFQRTYVTIISLFVLWLAFQIGGIYG